MPRFTISFGAVTENACGNHASVPLMVDGTERRKRRIALKSLRDDPSNAEVADAAEILLREAIARSAPSNKAQALTALGAVSVTVNW